MSIDPQKMQAFIGKALADMSGAAAMPMILLGTRLGFYTALRKRSMTAAALARATGTYPRYVHEWAHQQAAAGYLAYDAATKKFALPPEQAFCLDNEDAPLHLHAVSEFMAAMFAALDRAEENFRSGGGMHWGEHHRCLFHAQEYFNRGAYLEQLVPEWMPALGLTAALERGIRFADVGCGHGLTTRLLAKAFPNSQFVGFDNHPASVRTARAKARAEGLKNVRFEVADATRFPGRFDAVVCIECFHDMGDPAGVAARAFAALTPGGVFAVVDPNAGDRPEENHTKIGTLLYAGSTLMCCPASRALGGPALGAQAGPTLTSKFIKKGGFKRVEVVHRTPLFMLLKAPAPGARTVSTAGTAPRTSASAATARAPRAAAGVKQTAQKKSATKRSTATSRGAGAARTGGR